MKFIFSLVVVIGLFASMAWARPEYAVKNGTVSCAACHVSPAGGGFRRYKGKAYAATSKGFKYEPNKIRDYISFDLRALYFQPEDFEQNHGIRFMSGTLSGRMPLEQADHIAATEEDHAGNVDLLVSYDFIQKTARDLYVIWDYEQGSFVENVLFGSFMLPFGIMSDEHKTYVREQTNTQFHLDFETGVMVSGNLFFDRLHYDLSLISGQQQGVKSVPGGTSDDKSAAAINFRYSFAALPIFFGASASYYRIDNGKKDPVAYALYGALSLDRLFSSAVKGSLLLEWTRSKYNNSALAAYTYGDTAYATLVAEKEAQGFLAQLNIDITPRFTAIYKMDSLVLDYENDADRTLKHGLGFRYVLSRQVSFNTRYETYDVGLANATKPGDNLWVLFEAKY